MLIHAIFLFGRSSFCSKDKRAVPQGKKLYGSRSNAILAYQLLSTIDNQQQSYLYGSYASRGFSSSSEADKTGGFTHIDTTTNTPKMVDVSNKNITSRTATARAVVILPKEVMQHLIGGSNSSNADAGESRHEINSPKGPVFATAIVAGTMGAKRTWELIPFCHPLNIEKCDFDIRVTNVETGEVTIDCTVKVSHKTGVEMEALTGCTSAALCIYDMCKAMSHDIVIQNVRLLTKTGGKSDLHR